jgi:multicomponent Na+:H+ antiporter subunit B
MRTSKLAQTTAALVLVACACAIIAFGFSYRGPLDRPNPYLSRATTDTGATNLVAGIYLDYRLYDSLFELLVFSVAVLGVRFYLGTTRQSPNTKAIPESQAVRASADLLFSPILLIGVYLILFGHLSPGGGFSGGAVAGTGLLLCAVALGAETVARRFHSTQLELFEWGALFVVLLLVLIPLIFGLSPFTDLLPRGAPGELLSGGTLLIYNVLIGIKVFVGTWVVISTFIRHRGEI